MIVGVKQVETSSYLKRVAEQQTNSLLEPLSDCDVVIEMTPSGLQLCWHRHGAQLSFKGTSNKPMHAGVDRQQKPSKPIRLHLDFERVACKYHSFPAPKQGAFNQSLGNKTRRVADLSGGFGQDALLMSLQGYAVTVVERIPLMAVMIDEAFMRLEESGALGGSGWLRPKVKLGSALEMIPELETQVDCAYFDPMFSPKRKQSAASNKYMQFLQALAGPDSDSSLVASRILQSKIPRLSVKRPPYAEPLLANPHAQFGSKLVNYDVYIGDR